MPQNVSLILLSCFTNVQVYCISWAFLGSQLVKKLPAMWETWVRSLDWEDPLEKGKATHSSILAWRIPWSDHGVARSQTRLSNFSFHRETKGFPGGASGKEPACQCRRPKKPGFDPWVKKIPWSR